MDTVKEVLCFIFFMILFIVVIYSGVGLGVNYYNEYACGKYQHITGRNTKWVFIDKCYINSGSKWLTRDEYKSVIIAREGLRK